LEASHQIIKYGIQKYGILNLITELGGVYELLFYIVGIFVLPISQMKFYLKAIRKLYMVHYNKEFDKESDVFKENKNVLRNNGKHKYQVIQDKAFFAQELKHIHPIVLKRFETFKLFILTNFKATAWCFCRKNKKAKKLN
jgi:hypothetical protein